MSSILSAGGLADFSPVRRKPGRTSRHLEGGTSRLASGGEPDDAQQGAFSRKQLLKMDSAFVDAMKRAIARGLELQPGERRERAA
jgi:hypothetical protein